MTRRVKMMKLLWVFVWLLWLALVIQPESRGILRLAVILLFSGQLVAGVLLYWKRHWLRYSLIAIGLLVVTPLLLPGRAVDPTVLRSAYMESLKPYEGTTYSWGGENRLGIDCSGLVRKGYITANMGLGLKTLNGRPIREACSLWWYDASAKAMGEEYQDRTVLLFEVPSLNDLDHGRLLPGDIAVTMNGVHTLVYVGDKTWMQADPGRGHVQYEPIPVHDSGWFTMPMKLLRWRSLYDAT